MTQILFVTHSAKPSGAELSLSRQLTHVSQHELHAAFGEPGPIVDRLKAAGAQGRVHVLNDLPTRGGLRGAGTRRLVQEVLRTSRLVVRLRRLIRQLSADVVVIRSTRVVPLVLAATIGTRKPIVWSIHDNVTRAYLGTWAAAVLRRVIPRLVDGIVANSPQTLETVKVPAGRSTLILPPSIDSTSHRILAAPAIGEVIRVAMVGRISDWKGQDLLIEALTKTQERNLSVEIVGGPLFGEQEFESHLKRLAQSVAGPTISFRGHVDDVSSVYSRTHVVVHASKIPEPFGAVIAEGLAHGALVVAASNAGAVNLLPPGIVFEFEPSDAGSLARAIDEASTELRSNSAMARRMAGRNAVEVFTQKEASQRFDRWISEVIVP